MPAESLYGWCSQEQCCPGLYVWGVELSVVGVVIVLPEQPWIELLNLNGGTPLPRTSLCMYVGGWFSQHEAHTCNVAKTVCTVHICLSQLFPRMSLPLVTQPVALHCPHPGSSNLNLSPVSESAPDSPS